MEMHQIRYFLEVAETLNFTRAAENCHVAQPSLSRAIRKLEDELGGDLFRRERNRTHLTELGRGMRPLLRQAYDSAAAAKHQAASYKSSMRAPLRIGLSFTVHLDLILPMLGELAGAFPGLELKLARAAGTEILEALEAGDIELAIAAETGKDWDRLDDWRMFEEGFVMLARPDRAGEPASLSDVEETGVIARPYCETLAARPSSASAEANDSWHRFEVASDEDAARLAGRGMGVAIVPESTGRLLATPATAIDDPALTRVVRVYGVAGRRRSAAANGMLGLLRAADWSTVVAG